MYIVKCREVFPETAWREWRDTDGNVPVFDTASEAEWYVSKLRMDSAQCGRAFGVWQVSSNLIDRESLEAADRERYRI